MGPLVVPMNPEFLPEGAMLLAGVLAGAVAVHFLYTRQLGNGMKAVGISAACIALAFVLAGTHKSIRLNPPDRPMPASSPVPRDTFPGPPSRVAGG